MEDKLPHRARKFMCNAHTRSLGRAQLLRYMRATCGFVHVCLPVRRQTRASARAKGQAANDQYIDVKRHHRGTPALHVQHGRKLFRNDRLALVFSSMLGGMNLHSHETYSKKQKNSLRASKSPTANTAPKIVEANDLTTVRTNVEKTAILISNKLMKKRHTNSIIRITTNLTD
jgi:hypothetical protein